MKYTIKQFANKSFTEKMDMIRFIQKNKEEMFAVKKAEYKTISEPILKADLFTNSFQPLIEDITSDFIQVKTVINTTNVIDSHMDLHLPGIWNKTVKDNPYSTHLKSHKNDFEFVISHKAKSYNENMNFKDLGLSIDFNTQANINEFVLQRKTLPIMFDKYANGEVDQHSVGMIYVNLDLAVYDEDSQKEMDYFNEMKSKSINPDIADEYGFFWVISEAKKREGSAVVFGSNSITPTLSVKNYEPQTSTQNKNKPEPVTSTPPSETKTITNLNLFI